MSVADFGMMHASLAFFTLKLVLAKLPNDFTFVHQFNEGLETSVLIFGISHWPEVLGVDLYILVSFITIIRLNHHS